MGVLPSRCICCPHPRTCCETPATGAAPGTIAALGWIRVCLTTMNNEELADVGAANPFVYRDFTQESVVSPAALFDVERRHLCPPPSLRLLLALHNCLEMDCLLIPAPD